MFARNHEPSGRGMSPPRRWAPSNDCTPSGKARRPGDNPGPSPAPACTRSHRTVDCPSVVFEVARPINVPRLMGPAVITCTRGRCKLPKGSTEPITDPEGSASCL